MDTLEMIYEMQNNMNLSLKRISDMLTNNLNQNIKNVNPYTESKKAYIGDSEIIFENAKNGNISVFAITDSGKAINTITDKVNNSIRVSFDTLEEVATVTISIL